MPCRSRIKTESDPAHSCPELWTGCRGENDLDCIAWKIRKHADAEGGCEGKAHLLCEPYCAEEIADGKPEDHAEDGGRILPREALCEKSLDQGEEEESCKVSAGRAGKLCKTAAECGKYRESGCAQAEIDEDADGAGAHAEGIDDDVDGKISQGNRDRTDGNRDGQRPQDAEKGGCQSDECQFFCSCAACGYRVLFHLSLLCDGLKSM